MAVTDQQKLDFLLKKIGFTKTKTGSTVGTGAISGTPKQPFAEAIPSPLIIANGALWNESDQITATPPGSDTNQIKVYSASSALRMTADATSSGQRAYIAYSTYNDTSSTRLTNWIDTQFGALYLIKVYKGDPNSGGVPLSAGSTNENWFFDYSAGVLNFNDSNVPSGVTDTNIYIVGYRYIGQTGAPTSGISTFSFKDLTVERNLDVGPIGGISTFRNNIDANGIIEGIAGENKIPSLYANLAALPSASTYHGMFAHVHSEGRGYFAHAGNWLELVNKDTSGNVGLSGDLDVDGHTNLDNLSVAGVSTFTGDTTFSGSVSIGGTLTYEDVTNVDSVGLLTARSGIRVTGGVIEAQAGENKIPSLYANMAALPNAGTYHGMFAHVHNQGKGYFAHGGAWYELVNKELNGRVGTGTESYFIDRLVSTSTTATSLNVAGVSTFAGEIDANGRIVGAQLANVIPFYYDYVSQFPSASTYHGAVAHAHNTGRLYFAHAGWKELVNKESDGRVGLGTESYFINSLVSTSTTATSLNVVGVATFGGNVDVNGNVFDADGHVELDNVNIAGVTTFAGNIDANGDLDVDGHTNLDNVSVAGIVTANSNIHLEDYIFHKGDLSAYFGFPGDDTILFGTSSAQRLRIASNGKITVANDLDVDGTTDLDVLNVAEAATFSSSAEFDGNAKFDSTITAGGATGSNGQYLRSTGSGVAWASFPTARTSQAFTASSGQTTFSFSYTVGLVDVFVNGIKLSTSEFTATNGSTIVLAVGCFVGDIVEILSYNTATGGGGGGGLGNVVEDATPQLGGNLDLFNKTINGTGNINITGVVTATSFVGDGSLLTGVTASGTGIVIKNSGSTVGTAGTINFGDNLSVSALSGGAVTISAGAGATAEVRTNTLVVSGVSTFTGNVDTNGDLDVDGHTNLDNVSIAGVTTISNLLHANGNISITGSNPAITFADNDDDSDYRIIVNNGNFDINDTTNSITRFRVNSSGKILINNDLDVDGHTELDNVNVAGVVTATTFKGAVQATSGTFSSGVDVTGDLDVDGHTELDNVNVSGIVTATTFVGNLTGTATTASTVAVSDESTASNCFPLFAIASVSGGNIQAANVAPKAGSNLTFNSATGGLVATKFTGSTVVATGHIEQISASGISTFSGSLDVDGHTNLDNVSIAGVVTATTFVGALNGNAATATEATNVTVTANNSTNETVYPVFVDGATGTQGAETDTGLNYNPSTGNLSATKFTGDGSGLTGITASGSGVVIKHDGSTVGTAGTINFGTNLDVSAISGGAVTITATDTNTQLTTEEVQDIVGAMFSGNTETNITATYQDSDGTIDLVASGGASVTISDTAPGSASNGDLWWESDTFDLYVYYQDGSSNQWVSITNNTSPGGGSSNVGITTNLSGSFTASAGSPSTINTFGYGSGDVVVEYTVFIKNGSNFQSQKLLAMRDGTTIHSNQFAVMFSSSLLVQLDATISGGNILLRATPETGVSGSTTFKIKREVM